MQSNDLGDLGLDVKDLLSSTLSEEAELVAGSKHNGTPGSWLLLDLTLTSVAPGIGQVEVVAALVIEHQVEHSLQRYQVLAQEQGMVDIMVDAELQLLDPEFMELQVHSGEISVMMSDSLVPAMPQSRGPADFELLIAVVEIVGLRQHVISLEVELGQAEVTVHDVVDVRVRPSCFFLI